ncbi:MAG: hypothetical protein RBR88_03815, partial [Candidatus Saccharicenans sp.]|nr:hypothetical protein [Candidatus Saccharicenans sp.]
MKKRSSLWGPTVLAGSFLLILALSFSPACSGQSKDQGKLPEQLSGLKGPFDLSPERSQEIQYYLQETQVIQIGFDGKRKSTETYTFKLKIVPASLANHDGDVCTVGEFRFQSGDQQPVTIRELAGWSYVFRHTASGIDEKNQVFGIPHDRFESLTASDGQKIAGPRSYPIYNSFIDFHAFCDILARPIPGGTGIQDLKYPGQSIRHAAAFSEPPVHLGQGIKEGSVFRNGEVRLIFKGIGLVEGAACAVVGYDSGESTLKMIMSSGAGGDIVTEGGSEYIGDIYVDLNTGWVRKVTL